MKERELRYRVWREDVLEAYVLRIVTQPLTLILPGNFLGRSIRYLKVRTTEIKDTTQGIVGVELIIESEESFSGAAEIMKVVESWRIEITL